MFLLGCGILGTSGTYSPTPVSVEKINNLTIANGEFDVFSATRNINEENTQDINTVWDNDTLMIATFDTNLSAGNVAYVLANTSHLLIKRRRKGTYKWTTIFVKEINSLDDFKISFNDYYASNGIYEYAIVNSLNGAEGNYNIIEVDSKFNGLYIADKNNIYGTLFDIGKINISRTHEGVLFKLNNQKYPVYASNTKANYEIGEASGYFVEIDSYSNKLLSKESNDYRHDIIDFLTDDKPKILKNYDGRIWLVNIHGEVKDDVEGHYLHRIITFPWTETGDYNSEKDLYNAGLSDVPQEFWSNP